MRTKLLRYSDLCDAGIVNNRATLYRWIKQIGFPAGILVGPNTRAWPADEVEDWLQRRRISTEAASRPKTRSEI